MMLFFCACVEHEFFIHVSPNGSYQVKYSAHGDKMDLQDHDFPMPTGNKWNIHSTLEEVEVESYDYTAHRLFKRNESFPETFFKGDSIYMESLVKHPLEVHHANWFFWETFSLNGIFKGRQIKQKYPLIAQLITSPEDPPQNWLREGLTYLLSETLKRTPLEWNISPIIETELNNWIRDDLQSVNDSILFEEFDYYKNLGLDVIMQPVPPELYNEMDSVFKYLEDELKISMDMDGDTFDFHLILPGELTSTNSDSLAGDTLFWSFEFRDFMNNDYNLQAKSFINHPRRQVVGMIFFVIFAALFIGIKFYQD